MRRGGAWRMVGPRPERVREAVLPVGHLPLGAVGELHPLRDHGRDDVLQAVRLGLAGVVANRLHGDAPCRDVRSELAVGEGDVGERDGDGGSVRAATTSAAVSPSPAVSDAAALAELLLQSGATARTAASPTRTTSPVFQVVRCLMSASRSGCEHTKYPRSRNMTTAHPLRSDDGWVAPQRQRASSPPSRVRTPPSRVPPAPAPNPPATRTRPSRPRTRPRAPLTRRPEPRTRDAGHPGRSPGPPRPLPRHAAWPLTTARAPPSRARCSSRTGPSTAPASRSPSRSRERSR